MQRTLRHHEKLERLVNLARTNARAAEVCSQASRRSGAAAGLREMACDLAADHDRHVHQLESLIKRLGGDPQWAAANDTVGFPDLERHPGVLARLARNAFRLGPRAGALALTLIEGSVHRRYRSVMALGWDDETTGALRNQLADEDAHRSTMRAMSRADLTKAVPMNESPHHG